MKKTLTLYPPPSYSSKIKSGSRNRNHQLRKRKERNGVSPSEQVIRNLMNYSLSLVVLKTRETGFVNLVMN
jgi:hypothetical protein